tara:strand:- start:379 stop:492 length:114 start_codon:yes stop_codon:yes gene_type:complete
LLEVAEVVPEVVLVVLWMVDMEFNFLQLLEIILNQQQ